MHSYRLRADCITAFISAEEKDPKLLNNYEIEVYNYNCASILTLEHLIACIKTRGIIIFGLKYFKFCNYITMSEKYGLGSTEISPSSGLFNQQREIVFLLSSVINNF